MDMTIEEILDDKKTNRSKYIGMVNENIMEELTPNIVQYPTSASLITNMLNLLDSKGYWEQLAVDALAFELENIPDHGLPGQMIFINFRKQLENLNALNLIYLAEMFTDLNGWSYQMIFSMQPHHKEAEFHYQYKHIKAGKIYSPYEFDDLVVEGFEKQFFNVIAAVSNAVKSKMSLADLCTLFDLSQKGEEDITLYIDQVLSSKIENKNKPMTFGERAQIAKENLAKQKPMSLEQIREQAKRVMERSNGKNKKKG